MPTDDRLEADSQFRIALAKAVTTWALVGILAIAPLIVVAGINAIRVPEKEQGDQFFDIAKYVLGVLLPVIAFCFGQVNFETASKKCGQSRVRFTLPRNSIEKTEIMSRFRKHSASLASF